LRFEAGDHHIGILRNRFRHPELEVSGLVAAEGEARQVIAFDEESSDPQLLRKPWQFLERRGNERERDAWHPRDTVADLSNGYWADNWLERGTLCHRFLSLLLSGGAPRPESDCGVQRATVT